MFEDSEEMAFSSKAGSTHMKMHSGGLVTWNHDSFKSWIVCKEDGKDLLGWTSSTSNQGLNSKTCAKVQLRIVEA